VLLRGNAREFPDGGGKVDAGPGPDNLLGGRVIAWQRQTLCATVMATGEALDLRNYVVVATSNIGSRMLMESRLTDRYNFDASNQPGRPYRRHSNRIIHV
jgi:hypothetical protein